MSTGHKITAGIVTLNAASVLRRALTSVLRHKSLALEPVVMDSASVDGTVEMLKRFSPQIDHWRSEPAVECKFIIQPRSPALV